MQAIYIDITTQGINTGSGVAGTNSLFNVSLPNLNLDSDQYLLSVIDFRYQNTLLTPSIVYPIIQCDAVSPIIVNGLYGSILYKGQFTATDALFKTDIPITNPIALKINSKDMRSITFAIVRSDNGQPFPITPNSYVSIMLLIQPIQTFLKS